MHPEQKLNRTFARRIGKTLSPLNKKVLEDELPKYEYQKEKLTSKKYKKNILEIGFGMGEHFINQLQANPENLYIGAEVYLNGVANVLKYCQSTEISPRNFIIWPDDLDLLIQKIPDNSLDGIYVLFPDPWHKRRYLKKRLFNIERLATFKQKLRAGGFISFASDISDYFDDAKKLLTSDAKITVKNKSLEIPHENYIETKYHKKALAENRKPQFITGLKN